MPVEGVDAYPLYWPEGWPRSRARHKSAYQTSFARSRDDLVRTMRLMGVRSSDLVISTNVALRRDGLPCARMAEPNDPGVAVYWVRNGKPLVIACDRWQKARENLRAVWQALEGLRAVERCGSTLVIERAFLGFTALPANAVGKTWRDVLGVNGRLSVEIVEAAYRAKLRNAHPDCGGSHDAMVELNLAREHAMRELGAA